MQSSRQIHVFVICCKAINNTLSQIFFEKFPMFHLFDHAAFHHVTRMTTSQSTSVHTSVVLAASCELWRVSFFVFFVHPLTPKRKIRDVSNANRSVRVWRGKSITCNSLKAYIIIFIRVHDIISNHLLYVSLSNMEVCLYTYVCIYIKHYINIHMKSMDWICSLSTKHIRLNNHISKKETGIPDCTLQNCFITVMAIMGMSKEGFYINRIEWYPFTNKLFIGA
jgi:hypothetical protein